MLSAHFSTRSTILMVGKKCTISETGLKKKGWFIGKIVPRWRRSAIKYSYWQCELIHDDGKSDASTSRHSIRKKGVEFNDADFRLGIWPGTCSASTFENCSTREAFLLRASRVYQSIWYSCLIHVIFWTKIWAELSIHSFSKVCPYLVKKTRKVKERWIVKVHSCSPLNSWVIPFSKMTRSSETRAERRWWSSCVSSFEMEDLSC